MEHDEIGRMIEEALKPILEQITKLQKQIDNLDDNTAWHDHYHDNYASADHVERSENSFNDQIYRLRNDLDNLEYRINDVERKAERAQSTADSASRNSMGYY